MTLELNVQNDFATILDGVQPLTLKRRNTAAVISIPVAWRYSSRTSEAEPAGGHVAQRDVVWQFPWNTDNALPRLGDLLLSADGDCCTVLSVEQLAAATRLRCTTRNLALVYQLVDRIDVQQAVIDDAGESPEIVGWTTIRAALPARIQPAELDVDISESPESSAMATATYRIILGEQLELGADTRFVDALGNVYQLTQFTQAERIDALPVATAVKLPDAL